MIPRVAYLSKSSNLSDETRKLLVQRFIDLHPDWKITDLADDIDILPEELGRVAQKNSPDIRSELIKLWTIYLHGGVAISSDTLFLQNIDHLLLHKSFCSTSQGDLFSLCVCGAEGGAQTLAAALGSISKLEAEIKKTSVVGYLGAGVVKLKPFVFCPFRAPPVAARFVQDYIDGKKPAMPKKLELNHLDGQVLAVHFAGSPKVIASKFRASSEAQATETGKERVEASVLEMGVSFGGAVLDAVKRVATGRKVLASPEEVDRRSWICGGNPGRGIPKCDFFLSESGRCSKCGCKMSIKIRAIASSCPEGKW